MANAGDPPPPAAAARAPRLPRWTRQEILVLIQGKRVVEGRGGGRGRRVSGDAAAGGVGGAEPKWAAVATYCARHGVDRGAVQCRKRWSNLAGDFKKIQEWERAVHAGAADGQTSFWAMRTDARRIRRLPGYFDKEVYDILDGRPAPAPPPPGLPIVAAVPPPLPREVVFDSGRKGGDDGLFSDEEEEQDDGDGDGEDDDDEPSVKALPLPAFLPAPTPVTTSSVAERKLLLEASPAEASEPGHVSEAAAGTSREKQPARSPDRVGSPVQEAAKRKRGANEGGGGDHERAELQARLIEVLERNSRMVAAQLQAQNLNSQLDREQRRVQADSLLGVLGRLADALGRIADRL